jgi:hypothetical protein
MTDRCPTAQEAGDAVCDALRRAYKAVYGSEGPEAIYRGGWCYITRSHVGAKAMPRRKAEVLAMTDRLWARARENAEMKDSK